MDTIANIEANTNTIALDAALGSIPHACVSAGLTQDGISGACPGAGDNAFWLGTSDDFISEIIQHSLIL